MNMTKNQRILVVEDNPAYLSAAQVYLDSKAVPRIVAVDLDSALQVMSSDSSLSGVITDCFFPEKTDSGKRDRGRQVIERIAGHYPRLAETARLAIDEIAKYADIDDELREQIRGFAQLKKGQGLQENPLLKSIAKIGRLLPRVQTTQIVRNTFRLFYGANSTQRTGEVRDFYGDLMTALERDEHNQPLGILVAESAEKLGLLKVLATSTYHHDSLTQPIQDYCGKRKWVLVDCAKDKPEEKATPGFWQRAFESLERER